MASQKITELNADAAPTADDLIPTVNDPLGTPGNRKVTLANLAAFMAGAAALTGAFQPLDSDLTAIAALTTTPYGRALLTLADSAAARSAAGVVIGVDVEAHDATLTALAGLNSTAGMVVETAADTFTKRSLAVGSAKLTVANGDGASGDPTVDLGTVPLDALSDVDTSTAAPTNGQGLVYNSTTGWVPGARQVNDDQFGSPLSRWHAQAAGAMAGTGQVKVLFMGDSEFEAVQAHRPAIARLSALLNPPDRTLDSAKYANLGTWYPGSSAWGIGAALAIWTQTGSVTSAQRQANRGLAGQALQLTNGQTVTFPSAAATACEAVTFSWLAGSGGSTLDLKVDGSTVTTVDASVAGTYTATGLTAAAHSCGFASHGTTIVDYVQLWWGNTTYGVVPYTAAYTGLGAKDAISWSDFGYYVALLDPDVVVLEWGINDQPSDTTGATWYTNMSTLIDTIRAANADTSIVIWLPGETSGHTPWDTMRRQARKLATAKSVALADAGEVIPSMASVDTYSLSTGDKVHFSDKGAAVFSSVLLGVLAGQWMRDWAPVDGTGVKPSQTSTWRALVKNSGHYPILKFADSGFGGMWIQWYASEDDLTYPSMNIGANPSASFLPSVIQFGSGSAAVDTTLYRANSGRLAIAGVGALNANLLSISADTASTATTAEQDLIASTTAVPANLMLTNGDAVDVTIFGIYANNARTKQLKVYFGGSVIGDFGAVGASTDNWDIRCTIIRDAATAVRASCVLLNNGASPIVKYTRLTGLSNVGTGTSAIRLTATVSSGASASDAIIKGAKVRWVPN